MADDAAAGFIEREFDAGDRRGVMGVDADQGHGELRMDGRAGQAFGRLAQLHRQFDPRGAGARQAEYAHAADFEQALEPGDRLGNAGLDQDLIIGDQPESGIDQPQGQIGLSRAGWTEQENSIIAQGDAGSVKSHYQIIVAI